MISEGHGIMMLCLVLLVCVPAVLGGCLTELRTCTEPMSDMDVLLLGVKDMNRDVLRQHCETFEDVDRCIRRNLVNCRDSLWDTVGWIRATFSLICDEDFESYLDHSKCLSGVSEEDVCRDEFKSEVTRVTKTQKKRGWVQIYSAVNLTKNELSTMCNATTSFLECVEAAANDTCGWSASHMQHELLRRGFVHLFANLPCYLGSDAGPDVWEQRTVETSGLSIGAVAGVGLAVALGVVIVALIGRFICLRFLGEYDDEGSDLLDGADDTGSTTSGGSRATSSSAPSTSGVTSSRSKRGDEIALASASV